MTAVRTPVGWVTNSPEAATKLKAADRAYDRVVACAAGMKLADKVLVIRAAKVARDRAYQAVFDAAGKEG